MRKKRNDYAEPASFERILEASRAVWETDTDESADGDFNRAVERLRAAVNSYGRRKFERMQRIVAQRTVRSDPRQVTLFANVAQVACKTPSKVEAD